MLPDALQELIDTLESLQEGERREALISLAESWGRHRREPGQHYDVVDVRHDVQCSDEVGVFLRQEPDGKVFFALELGERVQTLTRALSTVLGRGLQGLTSQEWLALTPDFIPRLVGAKLVRLRSQTIYYVFRRIQDAVRQLPPVS